MVNFLLLLKSAACWWRKFFLMWIFKDQRIDRCKFLVKNNQNWSIIKWWNTFYILFFEYYVVSTNCFVPFSISISLRLLTFWWHVVNQLYWGNNISFYTNTSSADKLQNKLILRLCLLIFLLFFLFVQEYPTLVTYFDGEIISKKHPFLTRKWV